MNFDNVDLPLECLAPAYRTFVEIFRQHFGEENVSAILDPEESRYVASRKIDKLEDLNNITGILVIVHFPTAIVENENGEKETIYDLFVKIIPYKGTAITAIRTSFTEQQLNCGYSHSHLPRMFDTPRWESWCLGGGPIRHTLQKLNDNTTEPGLIGLLCLELKTLVATESLRGGPYIRLAEVCSGVTYKENFCFGCSSSNLLSDLTFSSPVVRDWFKKFLTSGKIKLKLVNNTIRYADSLLNLLIDATNDFIEYLDKNHLSISSFLPEANHYAGFDTFLEYIIEDGELYSLSRRNVARDLRQKIGTSLVTFKGKDYKMKVINSKAKEESHTIWLFDAHNLFYRIISYIIYLNEKYLESIDG